MNAVLPATATTCFVEVLAATALPFARRRPGVSAGRRTGRMSVVDDEAGADRPVGDAFADAAEGAYAVESA
jgi:hypothetical protein